MPAINLFGKSKNSKPISCKDLQKIDFESEAPVGQIKQIDLLR